MLISSFRLFPFSSIFFCYNITAIRFSYLLHSHKLHWIKFVSLYILWACKGWCEMTADRLHMIKSLKCHKWDEKGAEKGNHQQTNFYFIIKFFWFTCSNINFQQFFPTLMVCIKLTLRQSAIVRTTIKELWSTQQSWRFDPWLYFLQYFFLKLANHLWRKFSFFQLVFQFYIPNQKYCTYADELGIASTCL